MHSVVCNVSPRGFSSSLICKDEEELEELKSYSHQHSGQSFNDWVACFQAFRSRLSHASHKQKQNSVSHGLQLSFFLPSLSFLDLY